MVVTNLWQLLFKLIQTGRVREDKYYYYRPRRSPGVLLAFFIENFYMLLIRTAELN